MVHKVYVPLDGSEVADAAVPPGMELARRAGVPLELSVQDVAVSTAVLDGFNAFGMLVDRVRDEGHSLVAVGSHGRTGLARVALGSVSAAVVRHAPVPVLLTGPQWSEAGNRSNG